MIACIQRCPCSLWNEIKTDKAFRLDGLMFAVSLILLIGSIVSLAQGDIFLSDFYLYPGRMMFFIGTCGLAGFGITKVFPLSCHLLAKSKSDSISKYSDHLYT